MSERTRRKDSHCHKGMTLCLKSNSKKGQLLPTKFGHMLMVTSHEWVMSFGLSRPVTGMVKTQLGLTQMS